jgi:hypothetical protein
MKLRYARNFGKRAGTCWRLIFVYALMPWLHKYRILSRPDQMTSQTFAQGVRESQQYPSLNFISLRKIAESGRDGKEDNQENPMQRTSLVRFECDNQRQKEQSRLRELEEENRLLKEALAKVTGVAKSDEC